MHWVGIDVGGTFTDGVAYDETTRTFAFAKVPSTPDDPSRGVIGVLSALKLDIAAIERFVHGVTIGTNAMIEGKGAEVWMLVTRGFRDVLEIGRTNRPILYDIRTQKTPPLVPRTRAIEIDERLLFDGTGRGSRATRSEARWLASRGSPISQSRYVSCTATPTPCTSCGEGRRRGGPSRPIRLHFGRGPAAVSRVRALQYGGSECLYRTTDGRLSEASRARPW